MATPTELKHQLLSAVNKFDQRCQQSPQLALARTPLDISDNDIPEVKFLGNLPETDRDFFSAPHLVIAGLKTEHADISKSFESFYKREDVKGLWKEIDEIGGKRNLAVRGQPGTGKSTAVWRKVLEMAINGDNILWVSLHRDGSVKSAVYFQGRYFYQFDMQPAEIPIFLHTPGVPLDTMVLDGRSKNTTELVGGIEYWVRHRRTGSNCRSITTASTKVEEQRPHQNADVTYCVVHSWSIDEFNSALVQEGELTPLYDICAELFYEEYGIEEALCTGEDDDSDASMKDSSAGGASEETRTSENSSKKMKQIPVEEILPLISSRYEFSGGSARWMFNYNKKTIENMLFEYCNSTNNRTAILNGDIGPTSEASTNYFFGSSQKKDGTTEYFLVSKRAVELLGEATDGSVYETLYDFADRLENPSFIGWIVEADFFSQVGKAQKSSMALKATFVTDAKCRAFYPEAIHNFEHTKNKNSLLTLASSTIKQKTRNNATQRIIDIVSQLVGKSPGRSVVCKPTAWNQGGYDAVFVEFVENKIIHLRFAQITKGESHSLKGEYFYTVVCCFETAGYEVKSVEIALFLTAHNSSSFSLKNIEGVKFLENYLVFNSNKNWVTTDDGIQAGVAKYELTLSRRT